MKKILSRIVVVCGYDVPESFHIPEGPVPGVGILNYLQACMIVSFAKNNPNVLFLLPNKAFRPITAERIKKTVFTTDPNFPKEKIIIKPVAIETRGEIKAGIRLAKLKGIHQIDIFALKYHSPRVIRNAKRLGQEGVKISVYISEGYLHKANIPNKQKSVLKSFETNNKLQERLRLRETRTNFLDQISSGLIPEYGAKVVAKIFGNNRPDNDLIILTPSQFLQWLDRV